MDVKLDKWHKCKVDIEVLKELSKKSDIKGLQHVSLFFGLLIVTGSLAYLTWGTWWSVFWFLVYGNIYSFSNPLWHETGHKTAFQSKLLNEIFSLYKPNIVIHLAAQAGVRYSIENPISYVESNLIGTFHILEMARKYKPDHLLMASTSSVYGSNKDMPLHET